MNRFKIITILIGVLFISCINEKSKFDKNVFLDKFTKIKTQYFDLDTLSSKKIEGLKGTIIYYNRNNFKIKRGEKITLVLREYYDFQDYIHNEVNTLSDKNYLIKSSGIIFLEFKTNNKVLNLKNNKSLKINFPKDKLINNSLFTLIDNDFLQNSKWKFNKELTTITNNTEISNVHFRNVFVVPSDSIDFYLSKINDNFIKTVAKKKSLNKVVDYTTSVFINKLGYIQLGHYYKDLKTTSFNLKIKNKKFEHLFCYIFYKDKMSLISQYKLVNKLEFKDIPIIKNETFMIIIGNKNNKIFTDRINLTINQKNNYEINLKEISKRNFKKLVNNISNNTD